MKAVIAAVVVALAMLCSPVAHAWNCSDPLAERVVVPAGTAGSYGDGDGQLASFGGQLYECKVVTPGTGTKDPTTNTNTNQNSNSNSNSNTNKNTATGGSSTSTATGGNSTSTNLNTNVVTATGGSVKDSGNSSSTSTVKNSGNSSINDSGNSRQSQKQGQSQSSSSSANGNGNNSNDETTNVPKEVASAYAPTILPTVPCFKGFSGGAQAGFGGVSFGGGKIDANCAELEAARQAPSLIARCKIYIQNKYVRSAGVTMEDCLGPKPQPVVIVTPMAPVPAPIIVQVQPAPVVVQAAPVVVAPTPIAPALKKKTMKRVAPPCGPATKPAVWQNDDVDRLPAPADCSNIS
jgi:hypothetical protein